jgi:phosphohistidine phosphatase
MHEVEKARDLRRQTGSRANRPLADSHPFPLGCGGAITRPTPDVQRYGGNDMDLILWRHAEAEDSAQSDIARQLTTRGRKQAQAVAKWLRHRLPDDAVILVSPAARTVQTVEPLTDQYRTVDSIAPGAAAEAVMEAAGWPEGIASTVVVVGHQPTLGLVASRLVAGEASEWTIKKGGLWWLSSRERGGSDQVVVRAVISPDLA